MPSSGSEAYPWTKVQSACPTSSLYHDLADAVEACYGETVDLPVMVRYRSWIGGDRDGNPNVTAAGTRQAFQELRRAAIERHAATLEQLRRELSLSDRHVPVSDGLRESQGGREGGRRTTDDDNA